MVFVTGFIVFSCGTLQKNPGDGKYQNAAQTPISPDIKWPDPAYLPEIAKLPPVLEMFNGTPVTTSEQWTQERRPGKARTN